MTIDTSGVVALINERDHTDWELIARLEGGYTEGAFLIRSDSSDAVLKWNDRPVTAARMAQMASVISSARAVGWPTPAWLSHGLIPDGGWYMVTEFARGAPPEGIDDTVVSALLPAIDKQAGLRPEIEQDWSRYTMAVVFEGESGWSSDVRSFSSVGAELVAECERLTSGLERTELGPEDLVHGNLDIENFLMEDGEITGIIDVGSVGKGTRVLDLAGIIVQRTIWEERRADALDAVYSHALEIGGRDAVAICIVEALYGLLGFGVHHWPEGIDTLATRALRFLREVSP